MLVFYEYTNEEMLDYLKKQAPHAEIHTHDEVSAHHEPTAAPQIPWRANY